jgi:allantoinase
MTPSGVEEFEHVGEADLREAMPILTRLGLPLLVHAELPSELREPSGDPRAHHTWMASRPPAAESAAIALLIDLVREFRTHVHVVHLASKEPLELLRSARAEGLPITVETCPHYLTFSAERIADGATAFKCAPPIRESVHAEALWHALIAGDIDLVATDHSPAPPSLKCLDEGDFFQAWGGIASLQLGLAAVWTGAHAHGIGVERIVEWMSAAPARLAGLADCKGSIAPGKDADLVIWDPDAQWTVYPAMLYHRHPVTPYAGMTLRGRVHVTIVRGTMIGSRP